MLDWVSEVLVRCRGKEPVGNFNPLIIGELYWEQSSKWQSLAEQHIEQVSRVCHVFLDDLLREKCPKDVHVRLAALKVTSALKTRRGNAQRELRNVIEDNQEFPTVYNHYYTDTAQKSRNDRMHKALTESIDDAVSHQINSGWPSDDASAKVDIAAAVKSYTDDVQRDMERHSCEEALDYLLAMCRLQEKTYVANVTTQIIGRHLVRDLHAIFSPVTINSLSDQNILHVASEPSSIRRQREFWKERLEKLKEGQEVFRGVMMRV